MITIGISSLDTATLTARLRELAGEERSVQAEFLLHLGELDRRRSYLELGYGSLWDYCRRALHLREGAAGRRIQAMRVVQRFPALAEHVRDSRLCISTLGLLGPVLSDHNVEELSARAAFASKADVEVLVASVRPRRAPEDGVRRIAPGTAGGANATKQLPGLTTTGPTSARAEGAVEARVHSDDAPAATPLPTPPAHAARPAEMGSCGHAPVASLHQVPPAQPSRPELHPVSERFSLRVSLDAATKRQLDDLRALLAHKVANGDLAAVLKEAIACAIEKHGKRKGAVARRIRATTARKPQSTTNDRETNTSCNENTADDGRSATPAAVMASGGARLATGAAPPSPDAAQPFSSSIPASVRRAVWARDGGRCAWTAPDGTRCGSRWKLELDHIWPRALGGASTIDNLRVACRAHNVLHAEKVFGRDHVEGCRRHAAARARSGSRSAIPSG